MPHQLLSKIDYVISLAEKEHIPTTKFSVLLRLLNKAIQYGCSVSQDRFSSLHETSMTALDNCDTAFERFLRVSTEEGQAKAELETCEQFAGELTKRIYFRVFYFCSCVFRGSSDRGKERL